MVPATREIICFTEVSRSGEPRRPRKYFWATMLVAFCDQLFGNSTPRCSKAGLSGSPITASRISRSTASNGLTPASVKRLPTLTPSPAAVMAGAVALRLSGMTSPRLGDFSGPPQGGKTDTAPRSGRTLVALQGQLIGAREGVVAVALNGLGHLVEVREIAVHGGEQNPRHRVELGEPALGEIADLARPDLRPGPPHRRRDRLRQVLQLLRAHGPLVGGPLEPSQELLVVESLAAAITLEDGHVGFRALVRGEAVAAALALATAAHGVTRLGQPGIDHAGRLGGAVGATHTAILLPLVPHSCPKHYILCALCGVNVLHDRLARGAAAVGRRVEAIPGQVRIAQELGEARARCVKIEPAGVRAGLVAEGVDHLGRGEHERAGGGRDRLELGADPKEQLAVEHDESVHVLPVDVRVGAGLAIRVARPGHDDLREVHEAAHVACGR